MGRPKCPKCGEPARQVIAEAKVRAELDDNGLMGRIVGVGATVADMHIYVCGGGHEWTPESPVAPHNEGTIRGALITLVKQGIYPILEIDNATEVCIAIGYVEENHDPEDTRHAPRIEYQVSCGLPGDRAFSRDMDTYVKAKEEYREMVEERRQR